MSSGGGNAELVRDGFQAFLRGDFEALSEMTDPAVQWLWFEPGEWDCHDRDKVLATLRERQQEGVITDLNTVVDGGHTVFIEVTGPRREESELPDGHACMVVTLRDGRIVRMQDYRSRDDALAGAGITPRPTPETPAPRADTQPGWDQITDRPARAGGALLPLHP